MFQDIFDEERTLVDKAGIDLHEVGAQFQLFLRVSAAEDAAGTDYRDAALGQGGHARKHGIGGGLQRQAAEPALVGTPVSWDGVALYGGVGGYQAEPKCCRQGNNALYARIFQVRGYFYKKWF